MEKEAPNQLVTAQAALIQQFEAKNNVNCLLKLVTSTSTIVKTCLSQNTPTYGLLFVRHYQ